MEGEVIAIQEIFRFEQTGVDPDGRVRGEHVATGVRPSFLEHLAACGQPVSPQMFVSGRVR